MDPNPKDFPILSYLLSHFPQLSSTKPTPDPPYSVPNPHESLLSQMPNLTHPKVLHTMIQSVPEITRTQLILQALGPRPDSSAVDAAKAKIAALESKLSENVGVDRVEVEKEMEIYKAVVRLDDMHEAYVKQLRDLEERLVGVYDTVMGELEKGCEESEEVNEEVVRILRQAAAEAVEKVELSGRQLKFLPEAFGKLHGLLVLDLSHNLLEIIPDSIAGLQKLEELNVSSNLLVSLPDSIGLLLNLKILDVSGNKLNALPETIAGCSSLEELDASFNNLTYLPTNIGYGLMNLRKLSIHLNKIRFLPTSICEMRLLTYLDAHFNELHGLPQAIGRLTNLEVLNVSSNFSDLRGLPETIGDLINLRELDVSNNQIHALPYTVSRLENLTKLNLDQNPLEIPPMEVASKGAEAVREFMAKRWLDIIEEEKQRSMAEANKQAQTGWLAWGTSLLNNVAGVSQSVAGYLGGGKGTRDPYLDQQL
ncbi:hypothetical protein L1049_007070 [Liquidambar formosana]|uniref:Plant intracellular Ras-group-related LRR protein 3 n=1 Tax=Liquidambar formosana TaxID=63359 RepID=A0AAP0WUJ2_LIQFO